MSLGLVNEYTLSGLSAGTSYSISITSKAADGTESSVLDIIVKTIAIGKNL